MAEAKSRIKINKLLEEAGWRFFPFDGKPANIILESHAKLSQQILDEFGDNFEKTSDGYIDYLLLDDHGFPLFVLEAKKADIHPLAAKEQARKYALSQKCRFIILSNGNEHYLWDLERGNPNMISKFPAPETVALFGSFVPDTENLIKEEVGDDYIILTQKPDYKKDPRWQDETQRKRFLQENKLRFLRNYQITAIEKIQEAAKEGKDRFLFEMATGTGKTLTAAAVIKLFLRTGNARRVLFLVDRLELEDQAQKHFNNYLKNDYGTCIYKENRDDWRKNEIVVSTVQSFTFKNKYKRIFAPTDFDLVISDEAHRSIGSGNSRAVFEYFIGYKLGLTATPKDYLKQIDPEKLNEKDPRELERRMLLDTYTTFGGADGKPTYQYSLVHGVKDGFLVNPFVVDARTEITTQLLSEQGYSVSKKNEDGNEEVEVFSDRDFEKKFFSDKTNTSFCQIFLENALFDPVSNELGKTLVFCVSQKHATKITHILNEFADQMFPGKYQSDFAVQVTSWITDAKQFTINFSNNNLNGSGNFNPLYKTSKTRICVTVGMMTTGYDCPDLLNVCLMRPIFSPSDFIQIKGRGTRKHNFTQELVDKDLATAVIEPEKKNFKLFDFFANCEYFETEFNYDEVLKLPKKGDGKGDGTNPTTYNEVYESFIPDPIKSIELKEIGEEGMKIDRMYFDRFEAAVKENHEVQKLMALRDLEAIERYIQQNIFEKPEEYYNLTKLQKAAKVDRPITLREIIEKMFGIIPYLKSQDEMLNDEFEKFDSRFLPNEPNFDALKDYFKSYITDKEFREIIENKDFALLNTNPNGEVFRKLTPEMRMLIPQYIKENVTINSLSL